MSYRNDVEALEIKLAQLVDERAAIARERARLEESLRRVPSLDDELDGGPRRRRRKRILS